MKKRSSSIVAWLLPACICFALAGCSGSGLPSAADPEKPAQTASHIPGDPTAEPGAIHASPALGDSARCMPPLF